MSILIVDDEAIARHRLRKLLARDPGVRVVAECASVAECERLDPCLIPDLILLDVQMPERDGFELLKCLGARDIHPLVIFVSAHARHAIDAYAAGAVDYLLKPFDDDRFARAMTRSKAAWHAGRGGSIAAIADPPVEASVAAPMPDRVLVNQDGRILFIPTRDIDLVRVTGKQVRIFVGDQCYVTRQSLRNMERLLGRQLFVRVHRSTIINVNQIAEFCPLRRGDCEVLLKRGTRVLLSRRFHDRLRPFFVGSWPI